MKPDNHQASALPVGLNAYDAYTDTDIDAILAREVPQTPVCPRCGRRTTNFASACAQCRRYNKC